MRRLSISPHSTPHFLYFGKRVRVIPRGIPCTASWFIYLFVGVKTPFVSGELEKNVLFELRNEHELCLRSCLLFLNHREHRGPSTEHQAPNARSKYLSRYYLFLVPSIVPSILARCSSAIPIPYIPAVETFHAAPPLPGLFVRVNVHLRGMCRLSIIEYDGSAVLSFVRNLLIESTN